MIIPEPDSLVKAVPSEVDTPSHVLQALRAHASHPHLDYANAPVRLGGGFWAEIFAIQLSDPPSELAGELVLRIMPDEALARKEATMPPLTFRVSSPT